MTSIGKARGWRPGSSVLWALVGIAALMAAFGLVADEVLDQVSNSTD